MSFPMFTLINVMKTLSDNENLKINHSTLASKNR